MNSLTDYTLPRKTVSTECRRLHRLGGLGPSLLSDPLTLYDSLNQEDSGIFLLCIHNKKSLLTGILSHALKQKKTSENNLLCLKVNSSG